MKKVLKWVLIGVGALILVSVIGSMMADDEGTGVAEPTQETDDAAPNFPRIAVPERRLLTGLEVQAMSANPPPRVSVAGGSEAAASLGSQPSAASLLQRWVEIAIPQDRTPWPQPEPFIGLVYFDGDAGLSAQGGRAGRAGLGGEHQMIIRLPTEWPTSSLNR